MKHLYLIILSSIAVACQVEGIALCLGLKRCTSSLVKALFSRKEGHHGLHQSAMQDEDWLL
jgi:hypothetical protein